MPNSPPLVYHLAVLQTYRYSCLGVYTSRSLDHFTSDLLGKIIYDYLLIFTAAGLMDYSKTFKTLESFSKNIHDCKKKKLFLLV